MSVEPLILDLDLTAGRVVEAIAWPAAAARARPEPRPSGGYRLGTGPAGCVRVRIEAPRSASLRVLSAGRATVFPISSLLESPQQSPAPNPVTISARRLPWDALEVALADGGDGTVPPGSNVALRVAFNVLTPEPGEALVRLTAELRPARGGEPLWSSNSTHVVVTDQARAPAVLLNVPAPATEGSYVLEIRSTWQPVEDDDGSRFPRLIRRRRKNWPGPNSAVRRVSLAVLSPGESTETAPPDPANGPGRVVDSIDLVRGRGYRPVATGRTPVVAGAPGWTMPDGALVEAPFRDRLRGWIFYGSETATLGPADASGLAWSALGLHVANPGRLHRLSVTVEMGNPADLGVALVVPGSAGGQPRVLLDARATGSPRAEGDESVVCSWPIWPDAVEPVLLLVNRGGAGPIRIGSVTLEELPGELPPASLVTSQPGGTRTIGLVLSGPRDLQRFGLGPGDEAPADLVGGAGRLASYLAHCGASLVVLPESLADRAGRVALEGQASEDPVGPDRLSLILALLGRRGLSAWLDLRLDGPLPGLPAPDSPEARQRGLVRLDTRGVPDTPVAYYPLIPEVREALHRRLDEALAPKRRHPNLAGLLVRLGPGPTLLGSPDTGLDDVTYARFVADVFEPKHSGDVPGQGQSDPNRFAARQAYASGPGRKPWLTWRARELGELYASLARSAQRTAPGVCLAVASPLVDDGPAGREARQADLEGLPPLHAWQAVGFDLEHWPRDGGLIVLRGIDPAADPLGRDLAAHPDLDDPIKGRPGRGLLLATRPGPADAPPGAGLALEATPSDLFAAELPTGHALAVLDARWLLLGPSATTGREALVARLARVVRALPASEDHRTPVLAPEKGVAARTWTSGGATYLGLANDTPFTLWLDTIVRVPAEVPIDDLGRGLRLDCESVKGGRRVIVALAPFDVAALRIGAADATLAHVASYPPPQDSLVDAQFQALSAQLERLSQGEGLGGPPDPGFEPAPDSGEGVALTTAGPRGWGVAGAAPNSVTIDRERPHSGLGSLRLDAPAAPAAAVSEPFLPPGGPELSVRTWMRAEPPDARVRVWIEGQAGGQAVRQMAEIAVPPDWAERKVRAADLPAGGLEWARLRFELIAPGRLWIDDLAVTGSDDRRAMQALMTAVAAYREDRLADFARLAGSRWVRSLAPGATATVPEPVRTGDATDLPPGRRLR